MTLSVVIPTKDRHRSLSRLLESLMLQTMPADEILIVTGGRDGHDVRALATEYGTLPIDVIETAPSVCIQRNTGVRTASGTHVCLCDDDIELPSDYFAQVLRYFKHCGEVGAVSGLVVNRGDDGTYESQYPPASVKELVWRWLFLQSVWGELEGVPASGWQRGVVRAISAFYRRRGNTLSPAGWPLVTQQSGDVFRTTVYGLGASIVRRDWLLNTPYDEVFDEHGIGDNFCVAISFPGDQPIHVLPGLKAVHHREQMNRLDARTVHYRKTLALDYCLKTNPRFTLVNRVFLRWSVLGFVLESCLRRNWPATRQNVRMFGHLCLRSNPYYAAASAGVKTLRVS